MKVSTLAFLFIVAYISLHAQVENFKDVDFSKADSIARLYPNHSLHDLKVLAQKLTLPLYSEEEKFRAIYTWVCLNIDNDYALFQKNQKKRTTIKDPEVLRQWNKEFKIQVMNTLFKYHRTVCTGYAYLIRELSVFAGISCEMIDGYGRTVQANIGGDGIANHSWNAVKLRNQWYLCDATWSSGAMDMEGKQFIKKYDDIYFLLEPALFQRNHYPLDTSWMLLNTVPSLTYFLNAPIVYSSMFQYGITRLLPETFHITTIKGESLRFELYSTSKYPIKTAKLQLGNAGRTIVVPLQQDDQGYFIDHKFNNKGTFIMHVLLDEHHAFTYSIKVI